MCIINDIYIYIYIYTHIHPILYQAHLVPSLQGSQMYFNRHVERHRDRKLLLPHLVLTGGGSNQVRGEPGSFLLWQPQGRCREDQGGGGVRGLCF